MTRIIASFLIICLLTGNLAAQAPSAGEARQIDVVETATNYNPMWRAVKILSAPYREAPEGQEKPTVRESLKEIFSKPYLTHLGFTTVGNIIDLASLIALSGSPAGLVASRAISVLSGSLLPAAGYEVSVNMKDGADRGMGQIVGRSLMNIDATNLLLRTIGGAIGAFIGQAFLPWPIAGAFLGGAVGSILLGFITNKLIATARGKKVADAIQVRWNDLGRWVAGQGEDDGAAAPHDSDTAPGDDDLLARQRDLWACQRHLKGLILTGAPSELLDAASRDLSIAETHLNAALSGRSESAAGQARPAPATR